MANIDVERHATAYHEAGHITVAAILGARVGGIVLRRRDGEWMGGASIDRHATKHQRDIAGMAGPLAEAKWCEGNDSGEVANLDDAWVGAAATKIAAWSEGNVAAHVTFEGGATRELTFLHDDIAWLFEDKAPSPEEVAAYLRGALAAVNNEKGWAAIEKVGDLAATHKTHEETVADMEDRWVSQRIAEVFGDCRMIEDD